MGHPPRIPVWLRWEQSVIYFVTLCVADRKQVLANENAFIAFKNAAAKLRDWIVLAAILMPDHLHAIAIPTENRDAKISNFSAVIKRWMCQDVDASWKWQSGCFDRLLRSCGSGRTLGGLAISLRLQRYARIAKDAASDALALQLRRQKKPRATLHQ
jgi:hypothetical protein